MHCCEIAIVVANSWLVDSFAFLRSAVYLKACFKLSYYIKFAK